MEPTSERPTLVAIAVVEHDGCFLVGVRPEGKPLAGFAEFPGGKVDHGETPEQAAIRECREESGLADRGRFGVSFDNLSLSARPVGNSFLPLPPSESRRRRP